MNTKRIRSLNNGDIQNGPIAYWMDRDMRMRDNWALLYAQQIALENNQPLLVVYNLVPTFLSGNTRQISFKVPALQELEQDLAKKNIPLFILLDHDGTQSAKMLADFVHERACGALVTDFSPLGIQRGWKESVAQKIDCAFFEVDTHNIIPVWKTSEKKEYAARTIRPKIYKKLTEFCDNLPTLKKHPHNYTEKIPKIDWEEILPNDQRENLDWITPGEKSARQALDRFINERLPRYATDRNDPNSDAQSDLSPFLHYGMLSAQRIALEIEKETKRPLVQLLSSSRNKAKVAPKATLNITDHAGAFLEELIVRRELSDNFCFYEPYYDSTKCFPDWAQKTLDAHKNDKREYLYKLKEFEQAQTHDELWNACQQEMLQTGKMHGYMRMYWAKKILEWTKDADQAMEIAIRLNDTYELDGRDPNGYAGIAWSMGGVHDRPWFNRPIFGTVRYMARSGCDKKFDTEKYIASGLEKDSPIF